jgi:hypothetical protein
MLPQDHPLHDASRLHYTRSRARQVGWCSAVGNQQPVLESATSCHGLYLNGTPCHRVLPCAVTACRAKNIINICLKVGSHLSMQLIENRYPQEVQGCRALASTVPCSYDTTFETGLPVGSASLSAEVFPLIISCFCRMWWMHCCVRWLGGLLALHSHMETQQVSSRPQPLRACCQTPCPVVALGGTGRQQHC